MARDAQTSTVQAEYVQLDGGGIGVLPYSKVTHRGSLTLDGSGVGDTADCRVTFALPSNNVWQLKSFNAWIAGTSAYDEGVFELYYNPTGSDFGQSTQLDFEVIVSRPTPVISTISPVMLGLGQTRAASGTSGYPGKGQGPFELLSYNDVSAGADPVLWISAGTDTNVTGGTLRFALDWYGYSYEQARSALLYAGFANRS